MKCCNLARSKFCIESGLGSTSAVRERVARSMQQWLRGRASFEFSHQPRPLADIPFVPARDHFVLWYNTMPRTATWEDNE